MSIQKETVIEKLKTCLDPEIKLDVWTLGLIYDIQIRDDDSIYIKMTFTTPFCPYGPFLVDEIKKKVAELPGVTKVDVEVVLDPPWRPSEELQLMLGLGMR